MSDAVCPLCNKPTDSLHHEVEQMVLNTIRTHNASWVAADGSCAACIEHYRNLEPEDPIV